MSILIEMQRAFQKANPPPPHLIVDTTIPHSCKLTLLSASQTQSYFITDGRSVSQSLSPSGTYVVKIVAVLFVVECPP
jgi:hypothetical protein